MSPAAFISYSRRNTYIAARLEFDLPKAGMTVWRDASDIALEKRWRREIETAIEACDVVLLLASPEAGASPEVERELKHALAHGKSIVRLLLTQSEDLPDDWLNFQMADFRSSYADGFAQVVKHLRRDTRTGGVSLLDLIKSGACSVGEARSMVGGTELRIHGRAYCELPIDASGYTMLSLIAPSAEKLLAPVEIAVNLKFTGDAARANSFEEVVAFLASNGLPVWVLLVRGPRNGNGDFDLPLDALHVWRDAFQSSMRALQFSELSGRPLHLFLETPVALTYAVGGRMREIGTKRLYQLNRLNTGPADRYVRVLG